MEIEKMQHFSHEHVLVPASFALGVRCTICSRSFTRHNRDGYTCSENCYGHIHKNCAGLPQHINHSLHAQHHLTLAKRSLRSATTSTSCCYYCEKPFEDEYTYACDECANFNMHITCAMIPLPTITSNVEGGRQQNVVQYACHQNRMILVQHDEERKGKGRCFSCHSFWLGPAYSCTLKECENFLHKSCADLQQKIKHPIHSRHPLALHVSKPQSCRSCCKNNCALIFSCLEDGCNFHLCPECSFLDTTVKCRSHDHLLSLVKNASCEIQCDACLKTYNNFFDIVPVEVSRTRSFLFRCMECDFNHHFLCGPLPSMIQYEYHMHSLALVYHLNKDDNSDEFHCDVCEEEMDLLFRAYCCGSCKFVAHIHCLISEIVKVTKEGNKAGEFKALREHLWDEFGIEYTEGNAGELTLKDIMEGITHPAEKAFLNHPIGFYYTTQKRPTQKLVQKDVHNYYKQLNSCFRREGSTEDIDKVERFLRFDDNATDFRDFLRELNSFMPDEGFKIDDKYLRQKVADVDGYMVPRTLAPILKILIRQRNGDLGMIESLSPEMKSVACTLVCSIFDKMCKTKVEDVTLDDLQYWYFYLVRISTHTKFRVFPTPYPKDFNGLARAFIGLEAMRCEENSIKKLLVRIAELEADLERCKGLLEKQKRLNRSAASQFMKECFRLASELKGKDTGYFII